MVTYAPTTPIVVLSCTPTDALLFGQVLVAAKADVNHPRQNGVTPAYMAAQNGHTRAVRLLCAAKVDPNQCEHADGTSPM